MRLAQTLLLGVSLGAIYSLIALGFVLIYKGTKVINFAQGSVMLLGAYVIAMTSPHVGFGPAVIIGVVGAMIASIVVERLIAASRTDDHLVATILTIGVDVLLVTELTRRIGSTVLTMGDPWGDATVTVAGLTVPQSRLAAIALALVLIGFFFYLFQRTDWGVHMRASADDRETASLMGISQRQVAIRSWMIGGALAVSAGIFLAGFPNPGLDNTSHLLALNAIPAIIIGGMDSPLGAVVGGLIIGVTQTLADGYYRSLSFLGDGIGEVAPYIVMLIVLLWRPSGLFGTAEVQRV